MGIVLGRQHLVSMQVDVRNGENEKCHGINYPCRMIIRMILSRLVGRACSVINQNWHKWAPLHRDL